MGSVLRPDEEQKVKGRLEDWGHRGDRDLGEETIDSKPFSFQVWGYVQVETKREN